MGIYLSGYLSICLSVSCHLFVCQLSACMAGLPAVCLACLSAIQLSAACEVLIVFRDLKPSNIFMTEDLNVTIGKYFFNMQQRS